MTVTKEAVFSLKLDPDLRDAFMAEAEASHRPASQVVRELMREFVRTQQANRSYEAFVGEKVALARSSMRAGKGRTQDEVEVEYAARRSAGVDRRHAGTGSSRQLSPGL